MNTTDPDPRASLLRAAEMLPAGLTGFTDRAFDGEWCREARAYLVLAANHAPSLARALTEAEAERDALMKALADLNDELLSSAETDREEDYGESAEALEGVAEGVREIIAAASLRAAGGGRPA